MVFDKMIEVEKSEQPIDHSVLASTWIADLYLEFRVCVYIANATRN